MSKLGQKLTIFYVFCVSLQFLVWDTVALYKIFLVEIFISLKSMEFRSYLISIVSKSTRFFTLQFFMSNLFLKIFFENVSHGFLTFWPKMGQMLWSLHFKLFKQFKKKLFCFDVCMWDMWVCVLPFFVFVSILFFYFLFKKVCVFIHIKTFQLVREHTRTKTMTIKIRQFQIKKVRKNSMNRWHFFVSLLMLHRKALLKTSS